MSNLGSVWTKLLYREKTEILKILNSYRLKSDYNMATLPFISINEALWAIHESCNRCRLASGSHRVKIERKVKLEQLQRLFRKLEDLEAVQQLPKQRG